MGNVGIAPKRRINFNELAQVSNPASIHGIYPYRGKISAHDARLTVNQFETDKILLDPFCGSGTIIYEGHRAGLTSVGFDTNPLAVWLARGKLYMAHTSSEKATQEVKDYIARARRKKAKKMPAEALKHFHHKSAEEIMALVPYLDDMTDYVKACFFGTIALTARGCNHYKWTSSTVGKDITPKQYISFYDKFIQKINKHFYPLNHDLESKIYEKDSRKLSAFLPNASIDYVFTSPPYFDGLDYTAYYAKIIYSILDMDRAEIKSQLIQTVKSYEEDMKTVLSEIVKVTHENSLIVFVVGDKKIKGKVINGGDFFSNLLKHKPSAVHERAYTGSSSQIFDKLNKTERKEQIVVWDRSDW